MVSFSFTISISRRPSTSSPTSHPTSHPQPDFTSTHARDTPISPSYNNTLFSSPSPQQYKPISNSSTNTREDSIYPLLSDEEEPEFKTEGAGSKKRVCVIQLSNHERAVKRHRRISSGNSGNTSADMDDNGRQYIVVGNGEKEMRKSYGIGGAGNIRRPSEVIYPARLNADGTRRRSSVWSTITTPTGTPKTGGFWGFLRKGSV